MSRAPPPNRDQDGVLLVGQLEQLVAGLEQAQPGGLRVGDVEHLDLRLHHRLGRRREEAAVLARRSGARLLAAATTDGSSVAIGTRKSGR